MLEKLLDVLSIFLKKYFVQTIIAGIMMFITYYLVPEDNSMLIKFTTVGFCAFAFLVWFLITEVIKMFGKSIQRIITSGARIEHSEKEREENFNFYLEEMWSTIDELDMRDYDLLIRFVQNENKPHYEAGVICGVNSLLTSDWVYKSQVDTSKQIIISTEFNVTDGKGGFRREPVTLVAKYQYILKDEIYRLLKYSYEKYGRICHFQR